MAARPSKIILVEKRRNHASSSILLYQVTIGYVRKTSKRLKNIRIQRERERERERAEIIIVVVIIILIKIITIIIIIIRPIRPAA